MVPARRGTAPPRQVAKLRTEIGSIDFICKFVPSGLVPGTFC